MSLLANILESRAISTLVIGTVRDIMTEVGSPRVVFVNHPVGQTFGRPRARCIHQQILADALACVPLFKQGGQIIDLPHQWKDRPGSSWEEQVEREILTSRG